MLHGLLRLGLDIEVPCKADRTAIVHSQMHESGDVLLLKLHVCIEQGLVTLAAAPEDIAPAAQLHCKVKGLFYLGCCETEDVRGIAAARTIHKAGIAEHVGCAPQALDIRPLHLFQDIITDLIQTAVGFLDIICFGNQVYIMEAEIADSKLLHKLKTGVHLGFCMFHGPFLSAERLVGGIPAEHIRAGCAEIVPPGHGKGQVLAHLFTGDHSVRIIKFKCHGVRTFGPLI